jgi:putative PIN family toxin of toxin-antitoxin system
MPDDPQKVVFDCTVFAQAILNPRGPAGFCLHSAQVGKLIVFLCDYVIQEIRELPHKINPRLGVTVERIENLVQDLAKYAQPIKKIPNVFVHPHDPDDSPYVNLAVAANAAFIVSRDRHLLNLMDVSRTEGKTFKDSFPAIRIMSPDEFAAKLRFPEKGEAEPDEIS